MRPRGPLAMVMADTSDAVSQWHGYSVTTLRSPAVNVLLRTVFPAVRLGQFYFIVTMHALH